MDSRQEAIYKFIVTNFDEIDFGRQKALHSVNFENFKTYADFQAHQRKCILELSKHLLMFAEAAAVFIECELASMHDKSKTTTFQADGFYFLHGSMVFTSYP